MESYELVLVTVQNPDYKKEGYHSFQGSHR